MRHTMACSSASRCVSWLLFGTTASSLCHWEFGNKRAQELNAVGIAERLPCMLCTDLSSCPAEHSAYMEIWPLSLMATLENPHRSLGSVQAMLTPAGGAFIVGNRYALTSFWCLHRLVCFEHINISLFHTQRLPLWHRLVFFIEEPV